MIKTVITIDELKELEKMLNAGDEDYNIAVSNIKNLDLDLIYIKLLSKGLYSYKRSEYLNKFGISTHNLNSLSFDSLYEEIKLNPDLVSDDNLKEYYHHCVKKLVIGSLDCLSLPLTEISIKIKWPKCKQ